MIHIYNGKLLSHKKISKRPFAETWTDLEIIILSKVSQIVKNRHHLDIIHMWNLRKNITNELIWRIETNSQTRNQTYASQRGQVWDGEGCNRGLGLAYAH